MMQGLLGVVFREIRLYTYSKVNLALSLVTPFIYSLLLATALSGTVGTVAHRTGELSYSVFVVPGLTVLALLTSSMTSSQSIFQERDSGVLLEILSCPIHPIAYIAGKFLGTSLVSMGHAVILLASMTLLFGIQWEASSLALALLYLPVLALLISGIYMTVCGLVNSLQTFLLSMNFLSMVLMFSSTIFYPLASLRPPLNWLSMINPVTMAAEGLRGVLLKTDDIRMILTPVVTAALFVSAAFIVLWRKVRDL